MIPKIAHFYWGEKILPYLRYVTVHSFAKHNPDWKIIFYTPEKTTTNKTWNTDEHKYIINSTENYISELKNINSIEFKIIDFENKNELSEVHKSDLLRLKILSEIGGLWSDMDIVYLKPMINCNFDIGVCICDYGHSIGFMMSSKNNLFFQEIYGYAIKELKSSSYQSAGSLTFNKYFPTIEKIKSKYPKYNIYNIPMNVVYPYNANNIKKIFSSENRENDIQKETIGIHWYAGSDLAGNFINKKINNCFLKRICLKEGYVL